MAGDGWISISETACFSRADRNRPEYGGEGRLAVDKRRFLPR